MSYYNTVMTAASVERLIARTTDSAANMPVEELEQVWRAQRAACQHLAALTMTSPQLERIQDDLLDAEDALAYTIGALGAVRQELFAYTTELAGGYSPSRGSRALPDSAETQPFRLDETTRGTNLKTYEKMLSLGAYANTPFRITHPSILRDLLKHDGPDTMREALRTPGQYLRTLDILEFLVNFDRPYGGRSNKSYRETGASLVDACCDELLPLATQQEDAALAARVTELIINSFCDPVALRRFTTGEFVASRLPSYIQKRLYLLDQRRAALIATLPYANHQEVRKRIQEEREAEGKWLSNIITNSLTRATPSTTTRVIAELVALSQREPTRTISQAIMEPLLNDRLGTHHLLTGLGMSSRVLEEVWDVSYKQTGLEGVTEEQVRTNNVQAVFKLARGALNAPRRLHKLLNLHNFERFPSELLEDGHKALETPPRRYILYAVATWSPNSALRTAQDSLRAMRAVAQKHGIVIIPAEFSTERDILRLRRTLHQAGWPAADHAFINVHGGWNHVTAGASTRGRLHIIGIDAVRRPGLRGLGRLMQSVVRPGGTIHLLSCDTGQNDNGLAYYLAQTAGRTTYAPDRIVSVADMALVPDTATGGVKPMVTYHDSTTGKLLDPRAFHPDKPSL